MRTIAFTNQKGGVGKSTSCINMASILGNMEKKVLVIDLDPQANSTTGLGIELNKLEGKTTVYECITDEVPISEVMIKTEFKNVYIVPSYINLANAEIEIASMIGRETLLRESIKNSNIDGEFDFVLLDLPPTLGLLSVNGLTASTDVFVPIDAGIFAISGIKQLLSIINMIKRKLNPNLNICGVLFTKVVKTNLSKELYSNLENIFKDKIFKTIIHQSVKIPEAQSYNKPINYYNKTCKSTLEYIEATKELLNRI